MTPKVQVPLAAIVAPVNDMLPGAVVVKVPPHCEAEELATVRPEGTVSVNATPVNAVPVFRLVIVNVNVVVPFNGMVAAPKDFAIEGGAMTVTTSVLELLVLSSSVRLPSGSTVAVFDRMPAAVGVTANVTLNDAPAGKVTVPPLATQLRLGPLTMEQLIVPIGAIPPGVKVNELRE